MLRNSEYALNNEPDDTVAPEAPMASVPRRRAVPDSPFAPPVDSALAPPIAAPITAPITAPVESSPLAPLPVAPPEPKPLEANPNPEPAITRDGPEAPTASGNDPVAPRVAPTPFETSDPLAFMPLPVAAGQITGASTPPITAPSPTLSPTQTPTAPTAPLNGLPNDAAPMPDGGNLAPAAPTAAEALYYRDPVTNVVRVVSPEEFQRLTQQGQNQGYVTTFKGERNEVGGHFVYDPEHDRWYDPSLYTSPEQASANFDEAGGPVPWANDVTASLSDSRPMATQPAPVDPQPALPSNGLPTDPFPMSGGPVATRPALPMDGTPPVSAPAPSAPSSAPSANGLPPVPDPVTLPSPAPSPAPASPAAPSAPASPVLNGLPASSGAMDAVHLSPTTPQNALTNSTITPGPAVDRFGLAKSKLADWDAIEDPLFDRNIRSVAQNAAGRGQVGSGMVRGSFRDALTDFDTRRQTTQRGYLTDALSGSIDDAYRNIGIAERQQLFQKNQSDTAFDQQMRLQQLQDSESGQQFSQLMASMGFNAQQIQQAFANAMDVQRLSNDETGQAFYRALQEFIYGSQGDPADYYTWMAGQWARNTATA